jgi:YHS domain-containing protein
MKTTILTIAALTAMISAAFAAPAHPAKTAPAKTALICPVTGNKIASAAKAYNHETYQGKTYYFCCPECKPRFDKTPAKIVANAAQGKYQPM